MAKEQTAETLSPLTFCTGAFVAGTGARRVIALHNYVAGRRPQQHFSIGPSTLTEVGTGTAYLSPPVGLNHPAAGTVTALVFRVYLHPDFSTLTIGVEMYVASPGTTLRVTVRVGAAAAVSINATSANNDTEQTTTVSIASAGNGWEDVEVDLTRVSGAALGEVRYLTIQDTPVTTAASLPDPANA